MSVPRLRMHAYVLAVHDLLASAAYFIDVLGFEREWADSGWQGLIRDGARVMLGQCPDTVPASELGDHSYFGFFSTDDIDALHEQFAFAKALILSPPADKSWGWREMAVATPEGHRMMFGQWIGDGNS